MSYIRGGPQSAVEDPFSDSIIISWVSTPRGNRPALTLFLSPVISPIPVVAKFVVLQSKPATMGFTYPKRGVFQMAGVWARRCLLCVSLVLSGSVLAGADVAVLLEEPFGDFGKVNPTGHAAIYLARVCASSPVVLRHCEPGETGVVVSRYHRVGGYDWLAIPLVPYLYAVDDAKQIPQSVTPESVEALRDGYRRNHLREIVPDAPGGGMPRGDWIQLVGSSYDRKIYGFLVETSVEQDEELIREFNARKNKQRFNLFFHNCADFAAGVLNFYYPHAVHRSFLADAGIMTPKQVARSLVRYKRRHPDLLFSTFEIPQIPGSLRRSRSVDGVLEGFIKTKKYSLPLAVLHPFVITGVAAAYLSEGRFKPGRNALVLDLTPGAQVPLLAENLEAVQGLNLTRYKGSITHAAVLTSSHHEEHD